MINRTPLLDPVEVLTTRIGKRVTIDLEHKYCGACVIRASGPPGIWFEKSTLHWIADTVGRKNFEVVLADASGSSTRENFSVEVTARPRVRIDEILADPPVGIDGDSNGDGVREGFGDEFVEIVNEDVRTIDISLWTR